MRPLHGNWPAFYLLIHCVIGSYLCIWVLRQYNIPPMAYKSKNTDEHVTFSDALLSKRYRKAQNDFLNQIDRLYWLASDSDADQQEIHEETKCHRCPGLWRDSLIQDVASGDMVQPQWLCFGGAYQWFNHFFPILGVENGRGFSRPQHHQSISFGTDRAGPDGQTIGAV